MEDLRAFQVTVFLFYCPKLLRSALTAEISMHGFQKQQAVISARKLCQTQFTLPTHRQAAEMLARSWWSVQPFFSLCLTDPDGNWKERCIYIQSCLHFSQFDRLGRCKQHVCNVFHNVLLYADNFLRLDFNVSLQTFDCCTQTPASLKSPFSVVWTRHIFTSRLSWSWIWEQFWLSDVLWCHTWRPPVFDAPGAVISRLALLEAAEPSQVSCPVPVNLCHKCVFATRICSDTSGANE